MQAAAGFSDHTGWAIGVVLAGPAAQPSLVWRGRLSLLADSLPRQVYHIAAETPVADPAALIEVVRAAARESARTAIATLVDCARTAGHRLRAATIAAERRPLPDSLDRIMKAHALLHAAEGELYRTALAEAAADLGIEAMRVPRDTLATAATNATELPETALHAYLKDMGRLAGPPWQVDHRSAALGAWLALANGERL